MANGGLGCFRSKWLSFFHKMSSFLGKAGGWWMMNYGWKRDGGGWILWVDGGRYGMEYESPDLPTLTTTTDHHHLTTITSSE